MKRASRRQDKEKAMGIGVDCVICASGRKSRAKGSAPVKGGQFPWSSLNSSITVKNPESFHSKLAQWQVYTPNPPWPFHPSFQQLSAAFPYPRRSGPSQQHQYRKRPENSQNTFLSIPTDLTIGTNNPTPVSTGAR